MNAYQYLINVFNGNVHANEALCFWKEYKIYMLPAGKYFEFQSKHVYWPLISAQTIARETGRKDEEITWDDVLSYKMKEFEDKEIRQILMECDEKDVELLD